MKRFLLPGLCTIGLFLIEIVSYAQPTLSTAKATSLTNIELTFGSTITGVPGTFTAFTIAGVTVTGASFATTKVELTVNPLSGTDFNCAACLAIAAAAVTDAGGGNLAIAGKSVTDAIPPTLTINLNAVTLGSFAGTTDNSVSFSLAFSELMTNSSFTVAADIVIGHTGTVAFTAPVPADLTTSDNQNYTFTINGITGDGTLFLTTVGPTITDASPALNPMAAAAGPSATFTIDNTPPPTPPAPVMTAATDTGISNSDDNTMDNTPDFTVTGTAGFLLELLDGATVVGSIPSASGAAQTITSTVLTDGVHTIKARSTDLAGNTASSTGLSVTIDTTPPPTPTVPNLAAASDTGSSNTDNNTSDNTPTFSITGTSGFLLELVEDGATVVGNIASASGGAQNITATTLADGVHSMTARTTDVAGNVASSAGLSVTIDTTPPSFTAVAATPSSGSRKIGDAVTVTFTATGADATLLAGATQTVNGVNVSGSFNNAGGGSYTVTYTVASGNTDRPAVNTLPLSVDFKDIAGNTFTVVAFNPNNTPTIDAHAPVISSVTSDAHPGNGPLTVGQTITFTVHITTPETGLTINPTTYNTENLTAWSTSDGGATYTATYTVTGGDPNQSPGLQLTGVTATDAAGNVSASVDGSDVTKHINATVPTVTSVVSDAQPAGVLKIGQTITFTISTAASESGLTVNPATYNGEALAWAQGAGKTYLATYTVISGDPDQLVPLQLTGVTVTDGAGTSPSVNGVDVLKTIDAHAPIITGVTSDATAAGFLHIGQTITFTVAIQTPELGLAIAPTTYNGKAITWSPVGLGATYTATYTIATNDTDHLGAALQLTGVTATDAAGNSSAPVSGSDVAKLIDGHSPAVATVGAVTPTGGTQVAGYWNATNTGINISVPLNNDASLNVGGQGGTVQLQAKVSAGVFANLGAPFTINLVDINTTKVCSLTDVQFEGIAGFADGQTIIVTAIVTDAAGNVTTGVQSATTIIVDQTPPTAFTVGSVLTLGAPIVAGYWNGSNTGVNITTPIANDATLQGGTLQLQGKISTGAFANVGAAYTILGGDINTAKTLGLNVAQFQGVAGFAEGKTIDITAILTDIAGNATTGTLSATTIFVDRVAPTDVLTDDQTDNIVRGPTVLPAAGNVVNFTATFTEADAINATVAPTITISGGAAPITNVTMTQTSNLIWTYQWTVPAGDFTTGTITIAATDVAGNVSAAATGTKLTYIVDNTAPNPAPASLTPADNKFAVPLSSNLVIALTDITNINVKKNVAAGTFIHIRRADLVAVPNGDIDASSAAVSVVGNAVTINLTTAGVTLLGGLNGSSVPISYYVDVDAGAILDIAGNPWAGFLLGDNSSWNFQTYSLPTITNIVETKACIGQIITVSGNYFEGYNNVAGSAGIASVTFYNNTGANAVTQAGSITVVSDNSLTVTVPSAPLIVTQTEIKITSKTEALGAPLGTNTGGISAAFSNLVDLGPSSAAFALNGVANVCSFSNTSTTFKVTVTGGSGLTLPYTINYNDVGSGTTGKSQTGYTTGTNITETPTYSHTNTYNPVSVVDNFGCTTPSITGGGFTVFQWLQPAIPIISVTPVCLTSNPTSITLSGTISGDLDPVHGAAWNRGNGQGTFTGGANGNFTFATGAVSNTYDYNFGDFSNSPLNINLSSVINSSSVCSNVTQIIPIVFSTAPSVNLGGGRTLCLTGAGQQIQFNNVGVGGGATGVSWQAFQSDDTTPLTGTFTLANPTAVAAGVSSNTFTLSAADAALTAPSAIRIWATPVGGTCGAGSADKITIQFQPLNAPTQAGTILPSFNNPQACVNDVNKFYAIVPTTGSTYAWSFASGPTGATPLGTSGPTIEVNWGASSGTSDLHIVETDQSGCVHTALDINVAVNQEPVPTLLSPAFFSYGDVSAPVQLVGSTTGAGQSVFSGEGVYQDVSHNWFFAPANVGVGNFPIIYTFTKTSTGCSNSTAPQTFTVYSGSKSIIINGTRDGTYDGNLTGAETLVPSKMCSDTTEFKISHYTEKPLKIELSELIAYQTITQPNLSLPPASQYKVVSIKSVGGRIVNFTNGVPLTTDNNNATADFYANRGTGSSDTIVVTIDLISGPSNPKVIARQPVLINPTPQLLFSGPVKATAYCTNDLAFPLSPVGSNTTPVNHSSFSLDSTFATSNSIISTTTSGTGVISYFFNPNLVTIGNFDILQKKVYYAYQDAQGCNDTTRVRPVPDPVPINNLMRVNVAQQPPLPIITSTPAPNAQSVICVNFGPVPAALNSNVVQDSNLNPAITSWYNLSAATGTPLATGGSYVPPLVLTTNLVSTFYATQTINACVSPIQSITYEVFKPIGFTWDKSYIDPVNVVHYSTVSIAAGNVPSNLTWQILDKASNPVSVPTTNPGAAGVNTFSYDFSTPGANLYQSQLSTTSTLGCIADSTQFTIMVAKDSASGSHTYSQNFNGSPGGWVPFGKNSTWAWGNKSAPGIAMTSGSNAWVTNLSGPYASSERSFLYGPGINLFNLKRPLITFDSWTDTNAGTDGVVLQYSVDSLIIENPNKVWTTLGVGNDGQNWYTAPAIAANPSGSLSVPYGWSKIDTTLLSTKRVLDEPTNAAYGPSGYHSKDSLIMFRFAFASVQEATSKGGFLVDNVFMGNRTRTVLLENFRNTGNADTQEKNGNDLINHFVNRTFGTQLLLVNYDVSFPQNDPFNMDNPADPSARALYYGITTTPRSRLDGSDGGQPGNPFSVWGIPNYNLETLQLGQATIDLTGTSIQPDSLTHDSTLIVVKAKISPTLNIPTYAVVQMAIVEDSISASAPMLVPKLTKSPILSTEGGADDEFKYMLKKMLPNATGIKTGPLTAGNNYTFTQHWTPDKLALYPLSGNRDNLSVIVWLQNDSSKIVYQAEIAQLSYPIPGVVTGLEPIPAEDISIYPNPADQQLTIQLPGALANDLPMQFVDQMGRAVLGGTIPAGAQRKVISTADMMPGMYIIQLGSGNGTVARKKVIILHGK